VQLTGIHHLTSVSADIRGNYRFYTQVLGLRCVKRSVNQDDVRAYHLFYADAVGSPGTDLTFFDWDMPRERRGTRSIVRAYLRVRGAEALEWWARRLREHGVPTGEITERDGRPVLDFEDPEGLRLSLVDDGGQGDEPVPWDRSPVPERYQLRGLAAVVLSVPDLEPTDFVLREVLGMRAVGAYADPDPEHPGDPGHSVHVYAMGPRGPGAELHVAVQPGLPVARLGAGGVHHVAFRVADEEEHRAWAERLNRFRIPHSGIVDRYWFRSLYFREPNGILFELATDGPGFTVDEDPVTLGEKVVLPPFLEPYREDILAHLKPID